MTFPMYEPRYAFLIAGTRNLLSSMRDIKTLQYLLLKLDFDPKNIYVFCDSHIKDQKVYDLNQLENIFEKLGLTSQETKETDIFLSISAHGYQEFNPDSTQSDKLDEYFFFNRMKVLDDMMAVKLSKLNPKVRMLALIDTCHSETMLDLHQIKHPGLISISACADTQSSMQDISQNFGYGGGLVCAFADYLKDKNCFDILDLYTNVYKRLSCFGQHACLTRSKN